MPRLTNNDMTTRVGLNKALAAVPIIEQLFANFVMVAAACFVIILPRAWLYWSLTLIQNLV